MSEQRLADYQFSKDEAIAYSQSGKWKDLDPPERGLLQLRQQLLCMDFSAFHEGVEKLLGRPVWTHEFAQPDALYQEYIGVSEAPTFEQIVGKLPEHLRANMIVILARQSPSPTQDDGRAEG